MMIRKEIPDLLFATSRPGYDYGANAPVSPEVVSQWIAEVKNSGAKSIICRNYSGRRELASAVF
jgi:hypothetical protein